MWEVLEDTWHALPYFEKLLFYYLILLLDFIT